MILAIGNNRLVGTAIERRFREGKIIITPSLRLAALLGHRINNLDHKMWSTILQLFWCSNKKYYSNVVKKISVNLLFWCKSFRPYCLAFDVKNSRDTLFSTLTGNNYASYCPCRYIEFCRDYIEYPVYNI